MPSSGAAAHAVEPTPGWMSGSLRRARLAHRLCLVAQDLLAAPFDAEATSREAPGRWDARGEESYLVVSKAELGAGAVEAVTGWMIGDQFVLFVIEDDWPFGKLRPLWNSPKRSATSSSRSSEGESYGIVRAREAKLPASHPA